MESDAERFAEITNDALSAEFMMKQVYEPIDDWQKAHPVLGDVATTAAGVVIPLYIGLPEYMANAYEYAVTGNIDPNKPSPIQISNRMVGNTANRLNGVGSLDDVTKVHIPVIGDKGLGDVYQLGISIMQSALSRGTSGGMQGVVLAQFFGSAATSGIYDGLSRGMDPGRALLLGTMNGCAEAIGEVVSLDKLLAAKNAAGMRKIFQGVLVQMGIEGSEEAFTTVMNTLADIMVNGDMSEIELSVQSYMSQGMSREEAEKRAVKEWINGVAFDAIGGALSGGISAVGTNIGRNIGTYRDSTRYLIDLANQTAEGSKSREMLPKIENELTRKSGRKPFLGINRANISASHGNQFAEQVKQDLISQNTDTAVRAIENRLTELGETGDLHQKAQVMADYLISEMSGDNEVGFGLKISDQISANATANMRQVMGELQQARENFSSADYALQNESWTDEVMKGRFLDADVLRGNRYATADYQFGRSMEKNLTQMSDLEQQISEARAELETLSPTDTERKAELRNVIQEAETKLNEARTRQNAVLQDKYDSYSETDKNASVQIDGKEYKVSGLTKDGDVKLTGADGATTTVSVDDDRLPSAFRSLALKTKALGWASSAAFDYYKPGTDINRYIARVQNIRAIASEKIGRDAFMASSVVKALDNAPLAEFLYNQGQDLHDERQQAFQDKLNETKKKIAAAKTKSEAGRVKGSGKVDTVSGFDVNGKHFEGIRGMKLSKTQQAVVDMVNSLADTLNINYVIYNGEASGVNGAYRDGADPIIAININAGKYSGGKLIRALAAETLSHELTHFIEHFAEEEYASLRDAVVDVMFNKDSDAFARRVQNAERLLPENFKGDRNDAAVREVVADACTQMLKNSEMVTEIARQNMTAAQKVKDFIDQTVEKIRNAITAAFADSDPKFYRQEAKLILDEAERIQQLWDDGLKAATENYNAVQTAEEGAGVQLQMNESDNGTVSVDENPVVSALVQTMKPKNGASLIQYQMATENDALPKQIFAFSGNGKMLTDANGNNVFLSVRDIRDAVARANGFAENDIAKVNGFLDELGDKMEDYKLKYQFVGLNDIEDAKILLDRSGKIVLSAMVKNNEYAVNFDFTKLCKKRQALQKVIEELAREKGRVTENGSVTEVNLTAGNVQHINELLAKAGVETNCLGCFVEAKRANQQQLNKLILDDWNAIVDELYPDAKYFGFADKTGDVDLHDSTTDKEAFQKYHEALRKLGEEKKKNHKSVTPVEKARLLIENVPAARFKLKYSDLATENGRTRLHQEFPEIDSYAKSRLGTASFKTVESFTPYNAEIELLGRGSSVKVKDGKIVVKKDNGSLQRRLAKIAGVRSQSFSDFIVSHVYDVMQKTAALSARELPAHTYTKEISRAVLFGMTGEKHNLSVLLEVDPSVDPWSAGLTQNGDYFVGDYQHFMLKEGQEGKAHFIQSIGLEDAKKLQNTEGYSKNCGIIVVPLSYKAYLKALNDPEMRMIIGYHSSGMPVDVKSKTHYDMAADYQGVQNTQRVVRLVKPNYAIPEGVPSYATPPGNVVPLDGTSKTLSSDLTFDIKARFEELAKGKTGNERTMAAKQTLQEFLDFMNDNGLTAETTKSEAGYGKFPLYKDVQQTRDPYMTADHYIEYCISKGELPLFWEFATNQNYYKQVFDFNMFDRLSYNEKTGRHESTADREAYAPQEAVRLLDENGELLVPKDFFKLLDKYMKDYNFQMEKVASVVPEVIEAVKADKDIVSVSEQLQVADEEYSEAVSNNDMVTARRLVNQAAKAAGAILTENGKNALHLYHGTPSFGFTEFRPGLIFLTDNKSIAAGYTANKGYGRVREISEKYIPDDGTTETLLKNIKNVLGYDFREATQADVDKVHERMRTDSEKMSARVDDLWTGEALDELGEVDGYDQDFENKLYNIAFLPGYISEYVDELFSDPESDTSKDIFNDLRKFEEDWEEVRKFFVDNYKQLKESAAKDILGLFTGYDLLDFLIDAKYRMGNALHAGDMLINQSGSFITKESQRMAVEQAKDIGSYDLYGFAGDNQLVIDGNGAFWASIQAPALGEGTFTTDQIGIKAKELGYTSVKIKNIMDSSMNNYASNVHSDVYIFFNPSQVKSADPVTYDSNGDPIPLSQRFNPESNDIQYQTSDEWQEGPVYNHRALVSEQTLDRWLDAYAATNPNYAQAFITYMRPDDFLRLTTLTKYSRMHIEEESKGFTPEQVVKASKGQPIFLDIDTETGEILGHEGRHRMVALDRAGIFQVPVLLFDSSNKYSKTPIEELVLTGQDFGRTKAILEKATVRDLQPLSTGNKDVVAEKFSKKTRTESISEKYTGRTTLQFQVASDEDYMDAVNSGNTKDQQRMVDDAARAAGYTIRAFHGSPHTGISVFDINRAGENTGVYGDRAIWFTDSEDFADSMSYQQLEGSSAFRARRGAKGKVYDTYLRINNPFVLQNMTPEMRDLLWEMNLSKLRSMGMEPSNSSMGDRDYFFQTIDEALAAGNDQYVKFYVDYSMLQDAGYDGIIARLFAKPTSGKKDNSVEYGVFSPEQIKSADPVTYDDDGNVIPLSQRFNDVRPEIQYQLSNGDIETATYILDGRNIETGETVDFISGILDGRKKGETRTHNRLSRKWLGMAKNGLVYGRVRFGQPYEITKDSPEYKDAMIEGTNYDIKDGGSKWYYPVLEKEDFRDNPRPITRNGNYGLYQYQMADRAADDTQFESDERTKAWTDLRAENEILRESAEHLAKEIEKLTKRNDKLSRELKRTTTPETRLNDAKKLARQIVTMTQREAVTTRDKQYNKEMADELAERIKGVADYIVQSGESMDYDKVTEMAYEIAQDIVSNAEAEIDDGGATKELREQMKAALKGKAIYVAPNVRADTLDWNAFKKAHRDIFTFKDNGTPIDMVYESLLDEVPGLLDPKINNPGDMLNEMAEKWDLLQPKYENPYEQYENEAVSHFMNMIIESALDGTLRQVAPTYADKMNSRLAALREEKRESVKAERQKGREKLEALREEKNSRIEEVRQEGIARKQEALAKERADKWQRVEATRQYYQEMAARATTRRRNGSTRTRIKKLINDLNNKLIHPTELNHVPPELVKGTVDILNMIDLDSGRGGVKLAEKIAMLQQQYAKLQSDPSFAKYAYDSVVAENITKMAQVVGDTPLRSMSANQLEVVLHTLTELEYMIRAGVKQKLHNDNVNMYESGKNAIKATNGVSANSSKLLGNAADWYVSNTMRPDVVFDRFGGFAKDSEWVKLFNMLNNAQRYGMDLQMKFAQPFEALLKDKKNLAKLTSAKDEDLVDIGLKDENGDAIKVTRDFMLFVYMNLFNEDNIRHVMFGGITVPEIKEYLAGKGDRGFGKGHRKAVGISVKLAEINDAINNATDATEKARLLEEKDRILQEGMEYIDRLRSNIESKLTDYDKKWVDAWWKFNDMASETLNETTMDVY
ncbi:MAG: hypothetical protein J6W59_08505, partial [Bacteroidales bacterium]|nr:hypothetical protein [Bacteroidales bacterium]